MRPSASVTSMGSIYGDMTVGQQIPIGGDKETRSGTLAAATTTRPTRPRGADVATAGATRSTALATAPE